MSTKVMTRPERELLKQLPDLVSKNMVGFATLGELLNLVSSWMGSPSTLGFEAFARRWLVEGNAKDKVAEQVLKEVFGVGGDEPRRKRA